VAATYEFEGFGRRFVAAVIDNASWLLAFLWFFGDIGVALYDADPVAGSLYFLAFFSAWFNYFAIAEWHWGQTIGKNAMGMKVISADRGKISFGQASVRNLLRIVDFFLVGWVMIASTEKHQRLGDKAAKTVVVRSRAPQKNYGEPATAATSATAPAAAAETVAETDGGRGRLPEIGWSVADTMWALAAGLVLAVLSPLLVVPFDPDLDSDGALLAAQALFGASLVVVAVGTASRWRRSSLREGLRDLGLRGVALKGFGIALLALLAYYLAAGLFSVVVVEPEQEDVARELGVDDPQLWVAISAVALIGVLAPISEELFFRGMVFSGLRLRYSLWPAAIISGIIFGLPHVLTGPLAAIPLSGLGVALAWLYERTGSLWPCIFAHMVNNGLALALTS
jgi:hypothetical protein